MSVTHYTDGIKFSKRFIDGAERNFLAAIPFVGCVTMVSGVGNYYTPTDPLIKQAILFQQSLSKQHRLWQHAQNPNGWVRQIHNADGTWRYAE